MSNFINDGVPLLQLPRGAASKVLKKVAALFPPAISCMDKKLGPGNYMCRSLVAHAKKARDDFEVIEWGDEIEFAGIALDFVGAALKNASKYLTVIRTVDLDYEMILADIEAREDIALTD